MKKVALVGGGFFLFLFSNITLIAPAHAADYLGAAVVLQRLAEKPAANTQTNHSEAAKLRRDIAAYKKEAKGMTPEAAATAWLSLLDRSWKPKVNRDPEELAGNEEPVTVWNVLPPPAVWPELVKKIEARPSGQENQAIRELGLRYFAHVLVRDETAEEKDLAGLEGRFQKMDESERYMLGNVLDQINRAKLQTSDNADAMMKSLEQQLIECSKGTGMWGSTLELPDLVAVAGKEKAEAFLRRALVKEKVVIQIEGGEETKKLACKLALELAEQLKTGQWKLADSLDSLELYEAMNKRFGKEAEEPTEANSPSNIPPPPVLSHSRDYSNSGNGQGEARVYYMLGLIVADRSKEAVAEARKLGKNDYFSMPRSALQSLEQAGHGRAILSFFHELLSQYPEVPLWDDYVGVAGRAGETKQMLELVRQVAAKTDLSQRRRNSLRQTLYRALLADGQVDEGVQELQALLKEKSAGDNENTSSFNQESLALNLAELGRLLDRKEWMEAGIAAAKEACNTMDPKNNYSIRHVHAGLVTLLMELNRGPEAEGLLAQWLEQAQKGDARQATDYGYNDNDEPQLPLKKLASLYHQAGRHADVVTLLEQAPGWGVKDLMELSSSDDEYFDYSHGHRGRSSSFRCIVADSLAAVGRTNEAKAVVHVALDEESGLDRAYELLLKLDRAGATARLDELFKRNQFEERPLIWKAVLLKEDGKLEEAEATARRAIAIDPSDGDEGPGDRLRAYAVLADVVAARGDTNQATNLREAIKAIRLSEEADRFHAAGLLKKAISLYEESLTHFSEAYCIQSRLAIQMTALGMYDAAEEHYRRAYELMPESFGRVESHCFGCERAFEGEKQQGIAEKVFTQLAAKTPEKPQVHYLLGYLRMEEGRYKEALNHFRDATRLDPDYLNAWKKIEEVGQRYRLPQADRNAIALQMLRLDPGQNNGGENFAYADNLAELWTAVEAGEALRPVPPKSLLVLAASKEKVEQQEAEAKKQAPGFRRNRYNYSQSQRTGPEQVVLQNQRVLPVLQLLGMMGSMID